MLRADERSVEAHKVNYFYWRFYIRAWPIHRPEPPFNRRSGSVPRDRLSSEASRMDPSCVAEVSAPAPSCETGLTPPPAGRCLPGIWLWVKTFPCSSASWTISAIPPNPTTSPPALRCRRGRRCGDERGRISRIVGAGYTGLGAALALAQRGLSVVVLEAAADRLRRVEAAMAARCIPAIAATRTISKKSSASIRRWRWRMAEDAQGLSQAPDRHRPPPSPATSSPASSAPTTSRVMSRCPRPISRSSTPRYGYPHAVALSKA